jgi:hypothetical protein
MAIASEEIKPENFQSEGLIFIYIKNKLLENDPTGIYLSENLKQETIIYKEYIIRCINDIFIDQDLNDYINSINFMMRGIVKKTISSFENNVKKDYLKPIEKLNYINEIDNKFKEFIKFLCEYYPILKNTNKKISLDFSKIIPKIFIKLLKLNPFYYNYYLVYILNNCENSGIYSNFQKNLQPLNKNKFKSINQNQRNPQRNTKIQQKSLGNILGNSLTPNIGKIKGLEFNPTKEQINELERITKERQSKNKSRKSNRRSSYYQPNYQQQLPNTSEAFFQRPTKIDSKFNNNNNEESEENRRFEKAMEIEQDLKKNKNKLFRKKIDSIKQLDKLYKLPSKKIREMITISQNNLNEKYITYYNQNFKINKLGANNFYNDNILNKDRLKEFIKLFIINNKYLKDVKYETKLRSQAIKTVNFNNKKNEVTLINNIKKFIENEDNKSDASTFISSKKRHQTNILILKFLLNVLYKNLEKPISN